ncbi:MAG: type II toxin-antitoxin system prevent-host-death family antitoxin [Myxococcota bacterium]|nr:type II toxin-antitoxin system prevent-host-death family antitoxin [Myxococcota bacterium]
MRAISYTAARENLAKTMRQVCEDKSPVLVTRRNNASVVIIAQDEYEALVETAYLLRSPKNAQRLLQSIEQLEAGKGHTRTLQD